MAPLLTAVASAAVAALLPRGADACTAIGVGRDASATGYPMVGHTEDSGPSANDVRLARVPRKRWPAGSKRPLFVINATYPRVVHAATSPDYAPHGNQQESTPLAFIDQVSETYGYWDMDYGVQNEWGVSIGESTCTAKTVGWPADKPYGYNRAGIEDLSKIALERCKTARCAVETMGKIAVELGFYSADSGDPSKPAYSGSAECLVVGDADPGEVWVFDILTGKNNASAIWAAQRIPSNHITAVGNAFSILKMNLSDSENFAYSPGVTKLAEEQGWWSPAEEDSPDMFNFFKAYAYAPSLDPMLPPVQQQKFDNLFGYYSGRRLWRIFSLWSPEEGAKLDPNQPNLPSEPASKLYPMSVPAKGVTLEMVQSTFRDHYEGTPYDLTVGMAAGPYGNPNRGHGPDDVPGQWERAISMYRASWSFVLECKPNKRSVTWFGWDAPHGTAYLPFYGAATQSAPECYHYPGNMAHFSTKMAWWAFNLVNQYQDLNFRLINAEVRQKSKGIEATGKALVAQWDKEASSMSDPLAYLTEKSNTFADEQVAEWWSFAWSLIAKYRGFMIVYNETATGENATGQWYPEWWLRSPEVGYSSWTRHGPYHGTLELASASTLKLAEDSVSPSSWASALVTLVGVGVVAGVSHQLGLRQGRRAGATSLDAYYVAVA
eukprot:TRINITY_DN63415_c0_g1_i1.p1 TRINITY_DN63415_c0_g1~~TRINITY_DN63415_c0_g1_i1.p1  ORF type:complete len:688 (+),score=132.89 TRINITY_DN63415_c0_g1_i1:76-2064(+)